LLVIAAGITQTVRHGAAGTGVAPGGAPRLRAGGSRGEGRLVLVGGEAGIGKSALVERLVEDLPDARRSWGGCDGLFTPRPLGPLFDLADQLGGDLLDLCDAGAAREQLFGALRRQLRDPALDVDVVVVEDVHWADEATVDLLRFLGRRIRTAPVLLIVTYRDDTLTATDPLRLALGEIASQRSTRRVGLAPLSAAAVQVMAAGSEVEPAELFRTRRRWPRTGPPSQRCWRGRGWPGPRRTGSRARPRRRAARPSWPPTWRRGATRGTAARSAPGCAAPARPAGSAAALRPCGLPARPPQRRSSGCADPSLALQGHNARAPTFQRAAGSSPWDGFNNR